MSRTTRAWQNAVIAVPVFVAYVVACLLGTGGIALDEVSFSELNFDGLPTVLTALAWGAGSVFLCSVILDSWVAKLPSAPIQRLVVVVSLVCAAIALALWFDSALAPDDDRDIYAWLTIPAALLYGLIARLPPTNSGSKRSAGQPLLK